MARRKKLEIENAEFIFRTNFEGRPTKYAPRGGNRSFSLVLPNEDIMDMLVEDGWNVKHYIPKNGDENDVIHYVEVAVSYKYPEKAPHIYYVNDKDEIIKELKEEDVAGLDNDEILNVDVVVTGSHYQRDDGEWRTKAYLDEMYVQIATNRFANKYSKPEMPPVDDDETPF